jgi:hypothetical protein
VLSLVSTLRSGQEIRRPPALCCQSRAVWPPPAPGKAGKGWGAYAPKVLIMMDRVCGPNLHLEVGALTLPTFTAIIISSAFGWETIACLTWLMECGHSGIPAAIPRLAGNRAPVAGRRASAEPERNAPVCPPRPSSLLASSLSVSYAWK